MSYKNSDRVFPVLSQTQTAQIIGEILHDIYGGSTSAIKAIAVASPADLRTIKSWYEGRNVPNLSHFLELCKNAPLFLSMILARIGYEDLAHYLDHVYSPENRKRERGEIEVFSINFDTINSRKALDLVRQLNIRQLWFYAELKQGRRPGMADLMNFWATGEATAKRDLSDLARLGLIQYVGSRRSGYYSL